MNSIKAIRTRLIIYSLVVSVFGLFNYLNYPANANLVADENTDSQPEQPIQASYQSAIEALSQYPPNISVMIRLETDEQRASDEYNDERLIGNLYAIGSVGSSDEVAPITPRDLIEMFENHQRNGGTLQLSNTKSDSKTHLLERNSVKPSRKLACSVSTRGGWMNRIWYNECPQTLIANSNRAMFQSRRVPVFDLIVQDINTNKVYFLPNVLANKFCRDALNDVLRTNGNLPRNTIDLSKLRVLE